MTRVIVTLAMAACLPASAAIYGFTCLPTTSGGCAVNAASQLTVDVTSSTIGSTNAVSFLFRNIGTINSVITSIYWDDRTTNSNTANQYLNFGTNVVGGGLSQGVSYVSTLSAGGTLPNRNAASPSFVSDAEARPVSQGGVANNGVQEGTAPSTADALQVRIALLNTRTFNDVLTGLNNGTLRIGFHLQGLSCSGISPCQTSDAYVNGGPVPEPGSYLVLGLGLSAIVWARRKRAAAAAE